MQQLIIFITLNYSDGEFLCSAIILDKIGGHHPAHDIGDILGMLKIGLFINGGLVTG